MKKILYVLLFLFSLNSFAQEYIQYCPSNILKKDFSGNISSLSGLNLITRKIAENSIEKAIKKETGSKFNIKIENFYGINLLDGKIKSIQAKSEKYAYNGIYLSDVEVKTLCSYNHIFYENKNLYFIENMVLKFSAKVTKDDMEKIINSKKVDKKIASILKNISTYGAILPLLTKFKPISLTLNMDKNTKVKMKITKIYFENNNLKFDSFILIPKNK